MIKSQLAQSLANTYPEWSDIRSDEQSYGFVFLDSIANCADDLHKQLTHIGKNYILKHANINDIDVVNVMQLPGNFTFTDSGNNPAKPNYIPPTVTGVIGASNHSISIAINNDIESFWYTSIPNRIALTSIPTTNTFVDDSSNLVHAGILKLTAGDSTINTSIQLDSPYTKLWIQTDGGTEYVSVDNNSILNRGLIKITGLTRQGIVKEESIIFLYDDCLETTNEWREIYKVESYYIKPDTTKITIYAQRFGRTSNPQIQPPKDFYNFRVSNSSKENIDTFWELNTSSLASSVLEVKTSTMDSVSNKIAGFTDLYTERAFELFDMADSVITFANDIAIEPFTNRIWIVDNTKLYLFNNDLTIANNNLLTKKRYDANAIIRPSTYHIVAGDSVTLEYFWRRQISDIIKHQVDVVWPDGTKKSIVNGSMATYSANGWLNGIPNSNFLRPNDTFLLSQHGDYLFTLTTVYADQSIDIDQRIISVDTKKAIAQFDINDLIPGCTLKGIDFDSDQIMYILLTVSSIYYKYKVDLATDVMMIDYQKKTIYLKEKYDTITIS